MRLPQKRAFLLRFLRRGFGRKIVFHDFGRHRCGGTAGAGALDDNSHKDLRILIRREGHDQTVVGVHIVAVDAFDYRCCAGLGRHMDRYVGEVGIAARTDKQHAAPNLIPVVGFKIRLRKDFALRLIDRFAEIACQYGFDEMRLVARALVGDGGYIGAKLDRREGVVAVQEFNLDIADKEFIVLVGPSGCGKTTLLRLIAGLDKPQSGELTLNGEKITGPSPNRGYVIQQGGLFQWLTVEQNIASGLKARHAYKENKDKISDYISLIGLEGFEKSFPHQISGGMAQRVAIARALINEPEVLLLDEPMGALDSFTRADIQDKLLEIRKASSVTMILVTHDIDEAIYLSDRIVIMTPRPGKISEVMDIKFPHPRHRGGTEFLALRKSLLEKFSLASAMPEPEYQI